MYVNIRMVNIMTCEFVKDMFSFY